MAQKANPKIHSVVLINPYTPYAEGTNTATVYPPIGLLYIASTLEKLGVTCTVIDAGVLRYDHQMIRKLIHKAKPDMIGIRITP